MREFTISFHLSDETISVHERDLGARERTELKHYLKRGKYKNALPREGGPPRPLRLSDFDIGSAIKLRFRCVLPQPRGCGGGEAPRRCTASSAQCARTIAQGRSE